MLIAGVLGNQRTWTGLESLWIELPAGWCLDIDDYPDRPTYEYHSQSLLAFLQRHRQTLKDLRFVNATSIDPDAEIHTASSMRVVLDRIRTGLLALETARIVEVLRPLARFPVTADPPHPRPNWKEQDHKTAAESAVDQLARDLGVERTVWEYQQPHSGFSLGESHVSFKYEFGPYVLGFPAVDRTREVQDMVEKDDVDSPEFWRPG